MYSTIPIFEETVNHSILSVQSVLKRVNNDPNAFFLLWTSYQPELYNACLAWTDNQQDAEDALSEITLKAWQQLPKYAENITNLKGWLTRLSYNHCMDKQRQSQREESRQVELQTMHETDRQLVDDKPLPQELVLDSERSDYLHRAIMLLPERLREVIILRFWQGKSYQQIADQLAISSSAVGKRLQEASVALSQLMADYLEDISDHCNQPVEQAKSDEPRPSIPHGNASEVLFEASTTLLKEKAEIKSQISVTHCAVQVTWSTKESEVPMERTFILPLCKRPIRVEQRLRSLQTEVARHPTGWKKKLELAHLYYAIGHWEAAIDTYTQILQKRPWEIDLYLRLGQILRLLERKEEAIAIYEDALSQARQDSTRHHLQSLIAFVQQQYTLAATHANTATQLAQDNAAHWHLLGQIYATTEAYRDALRAYDAALALNPDDLIALSESYEPLVVIGRFREALERVHRTFVLAPHDLHAVKRLADHRSRMGLVCGDASKETKKLIRLACKIGPDIAYAEATRATYHLHRGKLKEAVAVLQEVVEKQPLNPDGWYYYARCLFQSGDSQLASDAILTGLAIREGDVQLYYAASEILPYAGRTDELQPLIKQMLARFPEQWRVWSVAGQALVLQGDEQGCAISAKATQLQTQLAEPWLQQGRTLALAGKDCQAIDAFLKGYQYIPREAMLLSVRSSIWLAESYQKLGAQTSSRKWWQEAARDAAELVQPDLEDAEGTNLAMAYYWQGRALAGLGASDIATQAYQMALDHHLLYPVRQDVLNRLAA